MELRTIVLIISGICAGLTCLVAVYMVYKHLRNYTRPNIQRYIVRILYMAPIYSICSFFALLWKDEAKYFDLVRDCYEAYLLYSFFCLLVAFINEYEDEAEEAGQKRVIKKGVEFEEDSDEESRPLYTMVEGHKVYYGEDRVVYVLKTKPRMSVGEGCHPIPTPCCNCKFGTGRTFLRWTKRCILQFVIFKPLLAVITVPLDHYDLLAEGSFDFTKGYIYITFIENLSITVSMYFLVLFYHAVAEELAPFRPIAKFLCIKAIILFAFWQSIIVGVLQHYEVFKGEGDYSNEDVATAVLELLIIVEMLLISVAMIWVFGYDTYRDHDKTSMFHHPVQGFVPLVRNLVDTVNQKDVVKETVKTFKFGSHKTEYLGKAVLSEEERARVKGMKRSNESEGDPSSREDDTFVHQDKGGGNTNSSGGGGAAGEVGYYPGYTKGEDGQWYYDKSFDDYYNGHPPHEDGWRGLSRPSGGGSGRGDRDDGDRRDRDRDRDYGDRRDRDRDRDRDYDDRRDRDRDRGRDRDYDRRDKRDRRDW